MSALALAALLAASAPIAEAQQPAKLKIGIVTFLSGGAAGPFGVPAKNAAELIIDALNAGKMPEPYSAKGIAGAAIETVVIDEAGGTQTQVTEYRGLVERQKVDLVIGYISSGDCQAVGPVAEELKKLTVLFDCGTPQIFEEVVKKPKYLFRTGPTAAMDSIGAARYLLEVAPQIKSFGGINQNYAWGQDSWNDFVAALQVLKPGIKTGAAQFPKLGAGQYGAEITALLADRPDAVHSSFWGGDMEAFVLQAAPRGLFQRSKVVLTTGETAMHRLGAQIPEGTIMGGRGTHGEFAKPSPLNDWFRKEYFDRFKAWPTYPSYKMAQAILGVKAAYEKAAAAKGGAMPTPEEAIKAFEHLEFASPSGTVKMAIGSGHQAIQDIAYGQHKHDRASGQSSFSAVKYYPAECVNPPDGVPSLEWIKGGFKGAKC